MDAFEPAHNPQASDLSVPFLYYKKPCWKKAGWKKLILLPGKPLRKIEKQIIGRSKQLLFSRSGKEPRIC
jgi:hypothetical protein